MSDGLRILDMTAGARAIWFDKSHPLCHFVDIRECVGPDFVADSRRLPLGIEPDTYSLVVFDPPHVNFSKNGKMAKNYGHHTSAEIKTFIAGASKEAHRVSKPNALMAFKWNDHDLKLESALKLMAEYWEPLFGQKTSVRTMRVSTTYWVMLKRKEKNDLEHI